MRVLIVEDDILSAQKVKNTLQYKDYQVIGPFNNGRDALEYIDKNEIDLAILDWELADDITGLDIALKVKDKCTAPIIFVTGNEDENVKMKAIEANVFAFLNKPFHERNLLNSIDLAVSKYAEKSSSAPQTEVDKAFKLDDKIFVKKNGRYFRLMVKEIQFIEASRHYVIIHTANDQVLANASLSAMLSQVNLPSLVRVHRSFAVNITKVESFDDAFIHFQKKSIPFSKTYKQDFFDKLNVL